MWILHEDIQSFAKSPLGVSISVNKKLVNNFCLLHKFIPVISAPVSKISLSINI